jgi:hypothetical protein
MYIYHISICMYTIRNITYIDIYIIYAILYITVYVSPNYRAVTPYGRSGVYNNYSSSAFGGFPHMYLYIILYPILYIYI